MNAPRPLHAIRLQSAWEPPTQGSAAWTRRFGRPAGVEPGQTVWLVIAGSRIASSVDLNGAGLPTPAGALRWAHDITPLLRDRNVLEIRSQVPFEQNGGVGDGGRQPLPAAFGVIGLEIVAGREGPGAVSTAAPPHRA